MAVKPNEVAQSTSFRDYEKIIDAKLRDPEWVKNHVRQEQLGNVHYEMLWIVEAGHFTKRDKELLVKIYEEAGWDYVKASNSEDGGERPGLWSIKLYRKQ